MVEGKYNIARDGFIYLLSYATLIISSVGFNFLVKALVDRYIPDALESGRIFSSGGDMSIIGFLAAVIIAFPIFVYINWRANKMLASGKMRHNTGVRHWLIYISLVIVILIIIWQLIAVFISYLGGTLVARFVIHTIITLVIAVAVLGYQWWHLIFFAGGMQNSKSKFNVFQWVVFALVATTIVGSFFIIDSPSVRRAKRLDKTRVERLANIHNNAQNFYGWGKELGHGRLPANLDELFQDPRVWIPADGWVDPETKERFDYRVLSNKSFELCATFVTEFTKDDDNGNGYLERPPVKLISEPDSRSQRFYHGIGKTCFDLTVI